MTEHFILCHLIFVVIKANKSIIIYIFCYLINLKMDISQTLHKRLNVPSHVRTFGDTNWQPINPPRHCNSMELVQEQATLSIRTIRARHKWRSNGSSS